MQKIKIKKLSQDIIGIKLPEINGDAGYDIYAAAQYTIKARSACSVKTGFCIELPQDYWFEIMPKSGLAIKHNIILHNGVIDNGYRGEVIVHVYNYSDSDFTINKNEKIAQGVIRKLHVFDIEEVNQLSQSKRGDKGFGSTGK